MAQFQTEKVFRLGNEEFGLSIDQVHSIEKSMAITEVSNLPPFVKGIINLRGQALPIVDLRIQLTETRPVEKDEDRIIVVTDADKRRADCR